MHGIAYQPLLVEFHPKPETLDPKDKLHVTHLPTGRGVLPVIKGAAPLQFGGSYPAIRKGSGFRV